jgi:hypothetical protein
MGLLAWPTGGADSLPWSASVLQSAFVAVASNVEGCGLIAYGQFCLQPANRRYASFWQPPMEACGRSTVVFTEGSDPSPTDWGSDPEACEIGGLGTLGEWTPEKSDP